MIKKINLLIFSGIVALLFALVNLNAPNHAYAGGSGTKQYVSTICIGCNLYSNTCDSGANKCVENGCDCSEE